MGRTEKNKEIEELYSKLSPAAKHKLLESATNMAKAQNALLQDMVHGRIDIPLELTEKKANK